MGRFGGHTDSQGLGGTHRGGVGVGGGHSRSTKPQPCYDGCRWGLSMPSVSGKLGTGARTWAPWEERRGCPRWGGARGSPRAVTTGLSPTPASTHKEWPVWSLYILTQPSPLPCCSGNRLVTGGRGYPIRPPIPTTPRPAQCHADLNKVQMGAKSSELCHTLASVRPDNLVWKLGHCTSCCPHKVAPSTLTGTWCPGQCFRPGGRRGWGPSGSPCTEGRLGWVSTQQHHGEGL